MDIHALRMFFGWCTVINLILFGIALLLYVFAGEWIYRVHTRWFPMSRETFRVAIYAGMGIFELLIIVFNLVPYLALLIVR